MKDADIVYDNVIISVNYCGKLDIISAPEDFFKFMDGNLDFCDSISDCPELSPGIYSCTLMITVHYSSYPHYDDEDIFFYVDNIKTLEGHPVIPIERYQKQIYFEGNNGADYIKIEIIDDDTIELTVGLCCVVVVHCIVPNEFLTNVLGNLFIEYGFDPKEVFLKSIFRENYCLDDYIKELLSKIKKLNWLGDEVVE